MSWPYLFPFKGICMLYVNGTIVELCTRVAFSRFIVPTASPSSKQVSRPFCMTVNKGPSQSEFEETWAICQPVLTWKKVNDVSLTKSKAKPQLLVLPPPPSLMALLQWTERADVTDNCHEQINQEFIWFEPEKHWRSEEDWAPGTLHSAWRKFLRIFS